MIKRLYIEIEEEIIKELKKYAKEEGRYLSKFTQYIIQEGLINYLKNKEEE